MNLLYFVAVDTVNSTALWGTWVPRPDRSVPLIILWFWLSVSATGPGWVWPCPLSGLTGSLRSRKLSWGPVLMFPCLLANLGPDKELLVFVYAGDKFRGIWPGPTSRLGTGGFLNPSVNPSIWPLWSLQWTPRELWTGQMVVLWIGMFCLVHEISGIFLIGFVWVCGSRRPWNLWTWPTPQSVARSGLFLVSPFWFFLPLGICWDCSDLV